MHNIHDKNAKMSKNAFKSAEKSPPPPKKNANNAKNALNNA